MYLNFHEFLNFLKAELYQIDKLQSPKNIKNGSFRFSKIDFKENLNYRKILKFSHRCVV